MVAVHPERREERLWRTRPWCHDAVTKPLACPRPPEPAEPPAFPVFASAAPVLASAAIWVVTQSPFALVFALLGPIVAVASLADARRQARRRAREEQSRFDRELDVAHHAIGVAHEEERAILRRGAPAAGEILAAEGRDPQRWQGSLDGDVPVTLGVGASASSLEFDPAPSALGPGPLRLALDELRSRATTLQDAPIVVDARLGIGVCGPAQKALAALNALLVQLARALPPDAVALDAHPATLKGIDWVRLLPHWAPCEPAPTPAAHRFEFRAREGGTRSVVVAVAANERDLPADCRVVIGLDGAGRAAFLQHPIGRSARFTPGFASVRECAAYAVALAASSTHPVSPRDAGTGAVPTAVDFAALPQQADPGSPGLPACLGIGADGPVTVDLVADGPHAVVGGTTGSGKSELLVTWVLAMASAHGPDAVTFLLVDFKGGAAFAPLRGLPHVVGTVTDLDESTAERALESLAAELRYRESRLAEHGARSIVELPTGHDLARLVIVVDEFAALIAGFPALHDLFADLAARGRSLGVHLILCTQRPAGSVRDAVLANCALRMSLRVNNRADSVAVIGGPDAAELPRSPAGRVIVSRGDGTTTMQLALAGEADAAGVARRWHPVSPIRRPWLDPLPAVLRPPDLPATNGTGLVFGLVDRPEKQGREAAVYDPVEQGHLLVVGGRRSGRSGALAAIAAATPDARWIPATVEGAWDAVVGALEGVRAGSLGPSLLLIDDLDTLIGRFTTDYRPAFLDTLAALLREGPASGVHVAFSASSVIPQLAGSCESKLVLRMPDRHEHAAAAGSAAGFDPALPPGGGTWFGARVQVVQVPRPELPGTPVPRELAALGLAELSVVSSSPAAAAQRLEVLWPVTRLGDAPGPGALESTGRGGILLGDPDDWNAAWALLGAVRSRMPILFHACSVSDYRALARRRDLPAPIDSPRDTGWLLHPDGQVERVRF